MILENPGVFCFGIFFEGEDNERRIRYAIMSLFCDKPVRSVFFFFWHII
jgi:hypothetical protein